MHEIVDMLEYVNMHFKVFQILGMYKLAYK